MQFNLMSQYYHILYIFTYMDEYDFPAVLRLDLIKKQLDMTNNSRLLRPAVQRRRRRIAGPTAPEATRGSVARCLRAAWAARRSSTAAKRVPGPASARLLLLLRHRRPHRR